MHFCFISSYHDFVFLWPSSVPLREVKCLEESKQSERNFEIVLKWIKRFLLIFVKQLLTALTNLIMGLGFSLGLTPDPSSSPKCSSSSCKAALYLALRLTRLPRVEMAVLKLAGLANDFESINNNAKHNHVVSN